VPAAFGSEIEEIIRTRLLPGCRVEIQQRPSPMRRGRGTANPQYAGGIHSDGPLTAELYAANVGAFAGPQAEEWWLRRYRGDDVAGFMSVIDRMAGYPPLAFPFNLQFNENMPLRDQPPVINNVPGALAIAELFDRTEWVSQSGNPVSYAQFIRKEPLHGNAAKPVIFQFAKGDMTVPNPTTSAILRAGDLKDRATYFRNDLAFLQVPPTSKNPHTFLTNISGAGAPYAVAAQRQIATFFASSGATTIDPDGAGPFFETPIAGPLPETLNFIP